MGHRAPWRHCERRNLALATREALQHRALKAIAARGALAFHTARWLPRTREGIVVNIRLVSLLTLLRLVSLSTWLITRSARVLQLWFRCGSGVVQVWFRCGSGVVQVWFKYGSGVVQVWFKCSSGVVPSRDAAAWLITRTAWVLRVWFKCGSGVVQVWFSCGSGVVQVWFKCGSSAVQDLYHRGTQQHG